VKDYSGQYHDSMQQSIMCRSGVRFTKLRVVFSGIVLLFAAILLGVNYNELFLILHVDVIQDITQVMHLDNEMMDTMFNKFEQGRGYIGMCCPGNA
jgi:hypothetical protein